MFRGIAYSTLLMHSRAPAARLYSTDGQTYPKSVRIVEVSPRDGLQYEKVIVPTDVKVELIDRLSETGLAVVEATSFVSPKWVPQLADNSEVLQRIKRRAGVRYTALVPNRKGVELALASQVDEIAVFGAASEQFSQKNINCSIEESFTRFNEVCRAAHARDVPVRAYVSCVAGCPYSGDVPVARVAEIAARFYSELGCYEISLGDTIGVGTPESFRAIIAACARYIPLERLAVHCHDTQRRALANVRAALACGVRVVDASVAGLGGCPYAGPQAAGNVSTESVVRMLDELGVETGVDLEKLAETGRFIRAQLADRRRSISLSPFI